MSTTVSQQERTDSLGRTMALIFWVYMGLRLLFYAPLQSLPEWQLLALDLGVAVLVLTQLKLKEGLWPKTLSPGRGHWWMLLSVAALGFVLGFGVPLSGIGVPWDLSVARNLVMLILVAPLLEGLLYRAALHKALSVYSSSPLLYIVLSAALFSAGHAVVMAVLPQLGPFVAVQTLYTLILGLACAHFYLRYGFRAAWAAHFLFNLFFVFGVQMAGPLLEQRPAVLGWQEMGLEQRSAKEQGQPVDLLIVDMPLKGGHSLPPHVELIEWAATLPDVVNQALGKNCLEQQNLATAVLQGERSSKEDIRAATVFLALSHGWHSLSQVSSMQQRITYMEAPMPLALYGSAADYKRDLESFFVRLIELLESRPVSQMLMAVGDSVEENLHDLKELGLSESEAVDMAEALMQVQLEAWQRILEANPNTRFWVSAGNGGLEGVGYSIDDRPVIPASLGGANLKVIASLNEMACPSPFSNFGQSVNWALGENIIGGSLCSGVGQLLKLSGSSQALYQAFLAGTHPPRPAAECR